MDGDATQIGAEKNLACRRGWFGRDRRTHWSGSYPEFYADDDRAMFCSSWYIFCFAALLGFVSDQFFGAEAAIAIALVNAIGNLAGFAGPYLVGWIRGGGGSYAQALIALALGPLLCATMMLIAKTNQRGRGLSGLQGYNTEFR